MLKSWIIKIKFIKVQSHNQFKCKIFNYKIQNFKNYRNKFNEIEEIK